MVTRRKSPDLLVTHSPLFLNLTTDVLTCLAVSPNFTAIESYEVDLKINVEFLKDN